MLFKESKYVFLPHFTQFVFLQTFLLEFGVIPNTLKIKDSLREILENIVSGFLNQVTE